MKLKNTLIAASLMAVSAMSFAAAGKNPLSVHVLNLQTGVPSEGVKVQLDKMENGKWVHLSSAVTSENGRISGLFPEGQQMTPGSYKVTFETGKYYTSRNEDTLFEEIPVIIKIDKVDGHYHVPLLLSQYGYSTYRGS